MPSVNYYNYTRSAILGFVALLMVNISCDDVGSEKAFSIQVVDQETGRGIPLVKLIIMSRNTYWTDSRGMIAFNEPGMMDRDVYFTIESDGYEYPASFDGRRNVVLKTERGGSAIIEMTRTQPAERLYRLTGLGIYKDSKLLGLETPVNHPNINAGVLGQDSQLGVPYNGKYIWIWGDTFLPPRYIGNFAVSAATSDYQENGGLDPEFGINYTYFTDSVGNSKPMIDPLGPGYVWFDWLMTVDHGGKEKLLAKFGRVNAYWQNLERGIAVFNDEKEVFERVAETPQWKDEFTTMGHPFKGVIDGTEYHYTTSEFRFSRVKRSYQNILSPENYESFTFLKEGTEYDPDNPQIERDADGNLIYGWKKATAAIDYKRQQELISNGIIREDEGWIQIRDVISGEREIINRGSFFWNEYRKKWIMIASGEPLGEVWYAEADTPVGPWVYATKVADHINAFYNPKQHNFFDKEDGRVIFFEGTYTKGWGENGSIIPYYHYNQMMYKLQLDRPEVWLPEPIYRSNEGWSFGDEIRERDVWNSVEKVDFYAYPPDKDSKELVAFYKNQEGRLTTTNSGSPLFYALPLQWDDSERFLGEWYNELKGFEFFEYFFKLKSGHSGQTIMLQSLHDDFEISNSKIEMDSVSFELEVYNQRYQLFGKVNQGKINGRWKSLQNNFQGDWEALIYNETWWPKYSKDVVPLYEFIIAGRYEYSTSSEFNGMMSEKPVCMVWSNPHNQLIIDSETESITVPTQ
ncbi:MAG: hypothetical protein RJQ09_03800 [Cyclobacteriaceae bacterium]